jgi:F0F1-type ATP synthase membrane subunit b/b'
MIIEILAILVVLIIIFGYWRGFIMRDYLEGLEVRIDEIEKRLDKIDPIESKFNNKNNNYLDRILDEKKPEK